MEPVLKDGDRILVNKMIKGARLFNVFAALDNEDFTIHRMPGWGNFKRMIYWFLIFLISKIVGIVFEWT